MPGKRQIASSAVFTEFSFIYMAWEVTLKLQFQSLDLNLLITNGPMAGHSPESGRPRVLVADDESVIADTLKIILVQNGYEAAAVYSGAEAVEAAKTWLPDLLLADVVMPDMSGIEAAIRIRALLPACRILLLSGQAATIDLMQDARRDGHEFEIILKPIHPSQLLDRLEKP
jgi:CheY-like chemotaxis protein